MSRFVTARALTSLALAGALASASLITTASNAEAYSRRGIGAGVAAGVIAGTLLGAHAYAGPRYYSYSAAPSCYQGPRQCDWADRRCWFNRYGERVCNGGEWRCWRPTVCD